MRFLTLLIVTLLAQAPHGERGFLHHGAETNVAEGAIAHGAAAPFTLQPLSERFDPVDGALDAITHVELMTDVIISGLRRVVTAKGSTVAATARQPRVKRAVHEGASRIRRG